MKRHAVDLLSLVAGLAVLGLGLVLLSGGVGDLPLNWVGPVVAIGVGVLVVLAARAGHGPDEEQAAPKAEE